MTDFQPVTRKKWLARRSLQRPRRNSARSLEPHINVDVPKFLERMERLCAQMMSSDYFIQALATIESALNELNVNLKLENIICLGLGPFTRQFQALHQFAFIICIQRHYKIKQAKYFDPVFSTTEKHILKELSCTVLSENCEGKYAAKVPTFFYLPHCDNCLTNNLLWRNWQAQQLPNAILINNSFRSLLASRPERFLCTEAEFILKIHAFVQEFPIDDDYETHNVFNDLSVHIFAPKLLPAASDTKFWAPSEPPVYENSTVIISGTELAKLTIT